MQKKILNFYKDEWSTSVDTKNRMKKKINNPGNATNKRKIKTKKNSKWSANKDWRVIRGFFSSFRFVLKIEKIALWTNWENLNENKNVNQFDVNTGSIKNLNWILNDAKILFFTSQFRSGKLFFFSQSFFFLSEIISQSWIFYFSHSIYLQAGIHSFHFVAKHFKPKI